MNRRKFLKRVAYSFGGVATLGGGTTAYGFWEAKHIRVREHTIRIPNLPQSFEGVRIAVLADFHHGPYVSLNFIREATELAQSLKPDLFALVGDYGHRGLHTHEELPPCLEVLSQLEAPMGVFAVPGNHDMYNRGAIYRDVISKTPLTDITNRGQFLTRNGEQIYIAGVDDLWWGKPLLIKALEDLEGQDKCVILLSHNPDFAEAQTDPRLSLTLSGHTHGGQVYLPIAGSPWAPTRFKEKYLSGLAKGPNGFVFTSRGLGESGYPIRFMVPPEIPVLTLAQES